MSQKTSHGKLRSVSGFLLPLPEPMLYCHRCGEVDRRYAAEMAAVCNRWWGLIVKLLLMMSRECFCRQPEAREKVRLGTWTMTAEGKASCLLLPSPDPKRW